jgi:uncharacterized protein (DUF433 family)
MEYAMTTLLDRITINPEISHGKPTIRGLRYPVDLSQVKRLESIAA